MNKFKKQLDNLDTMDKDIIRQALEIASKQEPEGRWKPKDGDEYYIADATQSIFYDDHYWDGDAYDNSLFKQGNVYRTKEQAVAAGKRQARINEIIQEMKNISGDWQPDWNNGDQCKIYINIIPKSKSLRTTGCFLNKNSTLPHFPTEGLAQQAIDTIPDLALVFGVEV